MTGMFYGCKTLKSLDLSHFDTANVITMDRMFSGTDHLEELNIRGWDTSKVLSYKDFIRTGFLIDGQPWKTLFE
jgi:surface protein